MIESPAGPSSAVIAMLERLIAIDTTSRNSNLGLIEMARDLLAGLGATVRLTWDDDHGKANLFATLGPADRPGLVLSGHSDVVPVEGQTWRSDPFRLDRRDDRLYGRGCADMKGFLAVCLGLAPEIAARPLPRPVHFALSYDEEVGCIGVRRLIADLDGLSTRPRLCVVGEPTGMRVVRGHKGKKSVQCQVLGHACHSALNHQGVNAVEIAAEMVARLRALQRRLREQGPFDPAYVPPYSTVHAGVIHGGTALNIVPAACAFEFEIRNLPRQDPEMLMAEIRGWTQDLIGEMLAVSPESGFLLSENNSTAGLDLSADDPLVAMMRELTGENDSQCVAFTTEAGLFQQAGIAAVVCGPGEIDQAHKPDEFVTLDQLARCETMVRRLTDPDDPAGPFAPGRF